MCSNCTKSTGAIPRPSIPETRAIFEQWTPPAESPPSTLAVRSPYQKIVGAASLAQSIRRYGHLAATLDPLGCACRSGDPSLLPATHNVTEEDLRKLPPTLISSPVCATAANMLEVIEAFRRIYCSTTGYDYAHVFVPEERRWLRQAAEGGRFRAPADPINPVALLDRLTPGRGLRALPPPHVPRQDALLDRRARHARADSRRGDRRSGGVGHAQHPDRHGAPRAG